MHLERLEKAGVVAGQLELSDDGRAMKYYELVPFDLHVTVETIVTAVRAEAAHHEESHPEVGEVARE